MVLWLKDCLTEKFPQVTARCVSKNRNCFDQCTFGDRTLAYSGAKVESRFYSGDLVTRTGDREIRSVSGRLRIIRESWHVCDNTRSRVQIRFETWVFQAFIGICINCFHNCEDRNLFERIFNKITPEEVVFLFSRMVLVSKAQYCFFFVITFLPKFNLHYRCKLSTHGPSF